MNPFGKGEVTETKEVKSKEDKLANSELGKKAEKTPRDIKISGHVELPGWLGGGGVGGSVEVTTHDSNSDAGASGQRRTNSVT